jgi:hypothetical protein
MKNGKRVAYRKNLKIMTYATEFTAVQKALGISNPGMSNSAFRTADEANAERIQKFEKDDCVAYFVDNALAVFLFKGKIANAPESEVRKFFSI